MALTKQAIKDLWAEEARLSKLLQAIRDVLANEGSHQINGDREPGAFVVNKSAACLKKHIALEEEVRRVQAIEIIKKGSDLTLQQIKDSIDSVFRHKKGFIRVRHGVYKRVNGD